MNAIALVKNKMKSAIVAFLYFAPVHVVLQTIAKQSSRIAVVFAVMFFVTSAISGKATELESMLVGLPWLLAALPFVTLMFISGEYKVREFEAQHSEA